MTNEADTTRLDIRVARGNGRSDPGPEIEKATIRASNDIMESGTSSVTGSRIARHLAKRLWDRYEPAFHGAPARRLPPRAPRP